VRRIAGACTRIGTDQVVDVRVELHGTRAVVFVGDAQIPTAPSPPRRRGRVGVRVRSTTASFDNILITGE